MSQAESPGHHDESLNDSSAGSEISEDKRKRKVKGEGSPTRQSFDPQKMTVEELRDELRLRDQPTHGLKPVLVDRLLEIMAQPGVPQHRLANGSQKRRRLNNKKEPTRDEFDTEEEFQLEWTKWRESRDNNNESVKRSRQMAKSKRGEQERLHHEREAENIRLESMVGQMKEEVKFLNKVLKTPEQLTPAELANLEQLLNAGMVVMK